MIKIATTNHIEKLDDALTRAGRFDLKIEMTNFDEEQAREMCKKFNLDLDNVITNKELAYNPAELQANVIEKLNFTDYK